MCTFSLYISCASILQVRPRHLQITDDHAATVSVLVPLSSTQLPMASQATSPNIDRRHLNALKIPPHLSTAQHFYLPRIPCSTLARVNPFYDVVQPSFDAWLIAISKPLDEATEQLLIQSMGSLFVCLAIPDAVQHKILPLCKMIAVLARVDDFGEELLLQGHDLTSEKEYYDFLLSLLEGQPRSSLQQNWKIKQQERMPEALLDAWKDIRASMSARQQKRFIQSVRDFLYAILWELHTREEKGIADLQTYQSFRKFTAVGYVYMIMAEYGNDLDLDEDVLANPAMIKLQELVAYHVAYVNDLLSFRTEFCHGHYQNLPSLLCVHQNYSVQESILSVCEMIRSLDEQIQELRREVLGNSELMERLGVRSYVDAMGYVMSGYLEWAYRTARYHGVDNRRMLRHGFVSLVERDRTVVTQVAPYPCNN